MDDLVSLNKYTMLLFALEVLDSLHCTAVLACGHGRVDYVNNYTNQHLLKDGANCYVQAKIPEVRSAQNRVLFSTEVHGVNCRWTPN